jgi:hypothetical protein
LNRKGAGILTHQEAALPPLAQATLVGTVLFSVMAAALSPSGVIILACGASLCVIIALLWRSSDPPLLLLPALFQWSEVSIWAYATAWRGTTLAQQSQYGADLDRSTIYGLLGVIALAIGLRLGMGASRAVPTISDRMRREALNQPFDQLILLVILAFIGGYAAGALGRMVGGGTTQIFLALANLKSAGLFMLTYWCLVRGERYGTLGLVIGIEVLMGLTGFFADFKSVILTVFVAAIAARRRVTPSDLVMVGFAAVIALGVAVFWSAIKPDYRNFLNQGSGAQEINVPVGQRIKYLWDRTSAFSGDDAAQGFDALVNRHGYTEFLGLVMAYVPEARPHEDGQLTQKVILHILIPRLVWPDKPALPSDTDVMAEYTGLPNTWNESTSISIGHLGELYIDFGWYGGLLGMIGIGFCSGFSYRKLRDHPKTPILVSIGLGMMVTLPIAYFGTAYIKLAGSFTMATIFAFIVQRYGFPWVRIIIPALRPVQ